MKTPTLENQLRVTKLALFLMGQHCREDASNPSLDIYLKDMNLLQILAGGGERDPEGKEFVYHFVGLALKELGLDKEEE